MLLELQMGELDLFVDTEDSDEAARYVLSVRAGLDLKTEEGLLRSVAAEEIDVRVEFLSENGVDPPIPSDLVATLVEGQIGGQLVSSLSEALQIKLPAVSIGLESLGPWIPAISRIDFKPSWPEDPQVRRGWVMLTADGEFQIVP